MKKRKTNYSIRLLVGLAILLIAVFVLREYYFSSNSIVKEVVYGNSMLPTIEDNQSVDVDYGYYQYHHIRRGDIVVINFKTRKDDFIKRVIALPEENITFGKDGLIYVNGVQLKEDYLLNKKSFNENELLTLVTQLEYYNNTIPKGYYLVLGDNRMDSFDSGSYGLVLKESIIGKIVKIM